VVTAWLDVLDDTLRHPAICRQPELSGRLFQLRRRLVDPSLRIVVVGQLKQGKSQLVNALINAVVCPVHDDVRTHAPTVIRHSDQPWANLVSPTGRMEVPIEQAARAAGPGVTRVEVGVPRALLNGGLVLIDTPGIDSKHPERSRSVLVELSEADAVLAVSDAVNDLSPGELRFLRLVTALCPNVVGVLTKIDLSTQWRRCLERDRALLAEAGMSIPLLPVSSVLRERAALGGDQGLNAESGFPALVKHLENAIKGQAGALARRSTCDAVLAVTEQAAVGLRAQLTNQGPDTAADMDAAQRAAEDLRRRSSRWQSTLHDGIGDLVADIDHDLRERTRGVLRHTDATFDTMDPAKAWPEYRTWLSTTLAEAVADNFDWTVARIHWLAEQVAEQFGQDTRQLLPDLGLTDPMQAVERMGPVTDPDLSLPKIGHKMITGLRGSYSGMLMFGLLTSLLGMPLINPVSVAAGALLGAKTLQEDRQAQLKRRQAAAKTAVQRHVDELVFQVGKHSKDGLRIVQRRLRDHFTEQTELVQDAINESVRRARELASADVAARTRRNQSITGEIEELVGLRRRASALVAASIAA